MNLEENEFISQIISAAHYDHNNRCRTQFRYTVVETAHLEELESNKATTDDGGILIVEEIFVKEISFISADVYLVNCGGGHKIMVHNVMEAQILTKK